MTILALAVRCALEVMTTDVPNPQIGPLTGLLTGPQTRPRPLRPRTIRLQIDQQRIVKDMCYKLDSIHETTLELDSHANTCVLGCDALIILDYNRPVSVVGYDESLKSKTYQTVSGVGAYDDPQNRRTLHLIINQAIHIPHLDHHLLCPMQCHVNDVTVNDQPKFLAADTKRMH
jgi:hypothetical protein